ncbi:IS110 family transposase [Neorhizobium galegae]|uniref:Transposase IS116/IS110/IS902 family protein n=1 Tax=Neorhizobium galegae bv. officinalis TaxID=323656 RepID=A0A0T7GAP7_NEOGA|nr:IS110 family transposase [Neorhizobium galegae]CDZ44268.1 Transposase IS116/IS110/IS902 family protein [Neorhizobium galegae bv. officinalis]
MRNITTIGLDIAKNVFQVHAEDANGNTVFNRKLRRVELAAFFGKLPPCTVAMEACGSANHWARTITARGHEVRLLPAQLVKAFIPRGKTDANDAIGISEAMKRKDIRFVPVKSAEQQGAAVVLRTRSLMVRQRVMAVNAVRSHLSEFGVIGPVGIANVGKLMAALDQLDESIIPPAARFALNEIREEITRLDDRIDRIDREIAAHAKRDEDIQRLLTIPAVGAITASTIKALVPDPAGFKSARHFAAWIGLTPKANSSGEKIRDGHISKMGNRELRSLLFLCSLSAIRVARRADTMLPWLKNLLKRRPVKVAAVALANKMARIVWALLTKGGTYNPALPDATHI